MATTEPGQPTPARGGRGWKTWTAIGCGGLFVLCLAVAGVGAMVDSFQPAEVKATRTAVALSTVVAKTAVTNQAIADRTATVLARPTNTVRPTREPTATREPTSTREPAATQTPAPPTATRVPPTATAERFTPEEQAYADEIVAQSRQLSQGLDRLTQQTSQVSNQPSLLFDQDWRIKTAVALALISTTADEAEALEPPESMAHIHEEYIAGMRLYKEMTTTFAEGLDEGNVTKVERAASLIREANTHVNEATRLAREFNSSR